jgi:hypothetical protein
LNRKPCEFILAEKKSVMIHYILKEKSNTQIMKDLIISPNPSGGLFSLSLCNCLEQEFTAYIFTPAGNLVYESSICFTQGMNTRQLDLHSLSDGMYFIFLRGMADFFTQKIIISRDRDQS